MNIVACDSFHSFNRMPGRKTISWGIGYAIPAEWKTALKNKDNTFENKGLARSIYI
jgi:hypothetical protein